AHGIDDVAYGPLADSIPAKNEAKIQRAARRGEERQQITRLCADRRRFHWTHVHSVERVVLEDQNALEERLRSRHAAPGVNLAGGPHLEFALLQRGALNRLQPRPERAVLR